MASAAESSNEDSFAEATSFVQAFMSEHAMGGGDSACRKVADDSIRTIKNECDALQKNVDTASKANQKCCNSGKPAVCSAEKSKGDLGGKSSTCKGEADALANAKITFTSTLDALKNGKCKSIHGSSAYKKKKAEHATKTKECNKLSGAVSEAKKALKTAIASAKKARRTCNKDARTALDEAFKTAKKACNSDKNKRAFTRAQHMKCVLDGKSLKNCKTGKYPSVKKTALSKLTCDATTTCKAEKGKKKSKSKKKEKKKENTPKPGYKDCTQLTNQRSRCARKYIISMNNMWWMSKKSDKGRIGNGTTKGTLNGKKCSHTKSKESMKCSCQYMCQKNKRCLSYDISNRKGDSYCILFSRHCTYKNSKNTPYGGVCKNLGDRIDTHRL